MAERKKGKSSMSRNSGLSRSLLESRFNSHIDENLISGRTVNHTDTIDLEKHHSDFNPCKTRDSHHLIDFKVLDWKENDFSDKENEHEVTMDKQWFEDIEAEPTDQVLTD